MSSNFRQIVVATVILSGALMAPLRADILEAILVKVNGDVLTKTDFEKRQVLALRQRNINAAEDSDELKRAVAEITPQLILDAVDELLLVQRGREKGYRMSDDQFKEIVERIKKENKIESDDQFQAALKQEDISLADLRKSLERQMIINRLQQDEVSGRLGTTEEEEREYYDAHRTEFTSVPEVTLREILIEVASDGKTINVGLDDEAKAKAEQLRARAVGGESFEKLAAEYSSAPSKANSGLVGPVKQTEIAQSFQDLIKGLKVGDISPVVRMKRGYQFVKLETVTEAVIMPFDQAREQIADRVFAAKRRGELIKYMTKLRSQALIEWKNEELHKAYDQGLAASMQAAATTTESAQR